MFDRNVLLENAKTAIQNFVLAESLNVLDKQASSIAISDLNDIVSGINQLSEKNDGNLRSKINKNIIDKNLKHTLLLAIAVFHPINASDFTLEEINENDKVVTSDGYQFNSDSLFKWINEKKKMINPYTNLEFCQEDQANIKAYAAIKNVKLTGLAPAPSSARVDLSSLNLSDLLLSVLGSRGAQSSANSSSTSRTFIVDADDLFMPFLNRSSRTASATASSSSSNTTRSSGASPSSSQGASSLFGLYSAIYMQKTVSALSAQGLTSAMLRANWRNTREFDSHDKKAMLYLVKGKISKTLSPIESMAPSPLLAHERLTPMQAIAEINSLSTEQLIALQMLYGAGLRGEHLRQFDASGGRFAVEHLLALRHYIQRAGFLPHEAMDKINGLSPDAAEASMHQHMRQNNRGR